MNFERLHIFLFNLCSGGTLLIYFTEGHKRLSGNGIIFLLLSVAFAICAFMHWYGPTLVIPLLLATIIERVRVIRFGSRIPKALFVAKEPTSRKFHQAFLLGQVHDRVLHLSRLFLNYSSLPTHLPSQVPPDL